MEITQAIKTMRAVRQYTDQAVGEEIIARILEAGRWAGSAKNVQPWKFIVVSERNTLDRLAGYGKYASHLREAPCAIVVVTEVGGRGDFDSGRAIQNMMLAAWADGVGSCIASMYREPEAKQILGIPDAVKLQQVVAFGYPQPNLVPMIEGKPLRDVLASTGRKPLSELVYWERWGNARVTGS